MNHANLAISSPARLTPFDGGRLDNVPVSERVVVVVVFVFVLGLMLLLLLLM